MVGSFVCECNSSIPRIQNNTIVKVIPFFVNSNPLQLSSTADIVVAADTLAVLSSAASPYQFSVTVRKSTKAPSTFTMPAFLVASSVPGGSISTGSGWLKKRTQRINSLDELVLTGICSEVALELNARASRGRALRTQALSAQAVPWPGACGRRL
jgi:hypothetical protein